MNSVAMRLEGKTGAYVVRLPDKITLTSLKIWGEELFRAATASPTAITLLIDSNTHDFESIEAMRYLRDLLSTEPVASRLARVAFVAQARFRQAEVVSAQEAYFNNIEDAVRWLETA